MHIYRLQNLIIAQNVHRYTMVVYLSHWKLTCVHLRFKRSSCVLFSYDIQEIIAYSADPENAQWDYVYIFIEIQNLNYITNLQKIKKILIKTNIFP